LVNRLLLQKKLFFFLKNFNSCRI